MPARVRRARDERRGERAAGDPDERVTAAEARSGVGSGGVAWHGAERAPPGAGAPPGSWRLDVAPHSAHPRARDARAVRLGAIATVQDAADEQRLFARLNGRPAVKLSIQKQPTANTIEVIDAVRARLATLRAEGAVPGNVRLREVNDQSVYIRQAVSGVTSSTIVGGALGVLAIALFLVSWRQTLVIVVALPLVVLLTLLAMGVGGLTLNLFSLGGLALGLGQAADSAIVMLENVTRRIREGAGDDAPELTPERARALARTAAREVTGSIVTGTGANLVSVLPFLLVSGLAALLFRELILVITFATLAAVLVAVTLVPMLAARLVRRELLAERRRGERRRPARRRGAPAGAARWTRCAAWTRASAGGTRAGSRGRCGTAGSPWAWRRRCSAARCSSPAPSAASSCRRWTTAACAWTCASRPAPPVLRADSITQRVERIVGGRPAVATQFAVAGGAIYSRAAVENATRSTIDVQLVGPEARELSTDEWIAGLRRPSSASRWPACACSCARAACAGCARRAAAATWSSSSPATTCPRSSSSASGWSAALQGVPGLAGVQAEPAGGRPEYRVKVDRRAPRRSA
jgi:multidrug efflux pump subunit AcrB